jgi:branched-subunit amino acid permease
VGGEMAISRIVPVKFSLTIHVGSKKKKRPNRALFFAIFFALPTLRRRVFSGLQAH